MSLIKKFNIYNLHESADDKNKFVCPSIAKSPNFRELEETIEYYTRIYGTNYKREQIIKFVDSNISANAEDFKKSIPGLDDRIACQLSSICIREKYNTKNVFIVDSINKMIYLFSAKFGSYNAGWSTRKLIAKDIIMDGYNKQNNDTVMVAKAFQTYGEKYNELLKKNKKAPTEQQVWDTFTRDKTRFLPAGIYSGSSTKRDVKNYAIDGSSGDNVLWLKNWMGKNVCQAFHGYYIGDERVKFMQKAINIVKDPNNEKQIEEFRKQILSGKLKMNFSYGCINLTTRFLKYIRTYGKNSFIFNISADTGNYLVDNANDYLQKQQQSEVCLSPQSLNATFVDKIA